MSKRPLNPGSENAVERLNRAIDALLTRADGEPTQSDAAVGSLVRLAGMLRDLPRDSFKTSLKSEFEGRKNMTSIAEPINRQTTALRTMAAPRITFQNAAKAIEFYTRALGAKENYRFQVGESIPHAELYIGDSVVMLTEEWPEGGRYSAETLGQSPIWLTVSVPDVDSFVERAAAEGMKIVRPPKDEFYGHRDALLLDPFGYSWGVYTVKEALSVEEMHQRMQTMTQGPEGGQLEKTKAASAFRPGFRTVTPYLVAEDAPALMDFAKRAFGAEETLRAESPSGIHGEVKVGDSMVMIGGGIPGKKFPGTLHPAALHVYVKDCDTVYKQALATGATSIDEPRDQEYGERSAAVKDRAGNFWYIATHKGGNYKPDGLNDVNPYLHPLRAQPLITFLKRAFGAREMAKHASPDGVIQYAEIRLGDSVVEMGEAHGKYLPMPAMFYLYAPDCDAVYRQALAAGGKTLQEPADQPYGDRNGAVTDVFGNTWYVATHLGAV
jgi:PhnB protein